MTQDEAITQAFAWLHAGENSSGADFPGVNKRVAACAAMSSAYSNVAIAMSARDQQALSERARYDNFPAHPQS